MNVSTSSVLDALATAGLDEDAIRSDYSGRGMYGSTCLGIVGSLSELISFTVAFAAENPYDAYWLGDRIASDSMGMSTIWYWPGVTIDSEWEPGDPVPDGFRVYDGDGESGPCKPHLVPIDDSVVPDSIDGYPVLPPKVAS